MWLFLLGILVGIVYVVAVPFFDLLPTKTEVLQMFAFLNGKKTYLGVIAWAVVQLLMQYKPEWAAVLSQAEVVTLALTGVGVGHKLEKMS